MRKDQKTPFTANELKVLLRYRTKETVSKMAGISRQRVDQLAGKQPKRIILTSRKLYRIRRVYTSIFWSYVDIKTLNDCWNWKGCVWKTGYGGFYAGKDGREYAHAYAYKQMYGDIPAGMYVLHKCDNPSCCNPNHLYAGTPMQNVIDREERRKSPTKKKIILELLEQGYSAKQIEKKTGIRATYVYAIKYLSKHK